MDERILTGAMCVLLSAIFGGHGLWSLVIAYRTGDHAAWTERALQGVLGAMASGIFADLSAHLIT